MPRKVKWKPRERKQMSSSILHKTDVCGHRNSQSESPKTRNGILIMPTFIYMCTCICICVCVYIYTPHVYWQRVQIAASRFPKGNLKQLYLCVCFLVIIKAGFYMYAFF